MARNTEQPEVAALLRGRFAPTPSGPLHFGSLIAAAGSYLDARSRGGEWLVRMEDLDPPRVVPGAADDILRTLEAFGFAWDGPVMWQSSRTEAYREAFDQLRPRGAVYACGCSRAMQEGFGCSGQCDEGMPQGRTVRSWRFRAPKASLAWTDRLRGPQQESVPDFVVRRGDGVFAYQLAVVVDDSEQGITDVVRGADLLDSTPRQICLQQLLRLPTPGYLHLPVACKPNGEKLSKQTHAPAIRPLDAVAHLRAALLFLGQDLPDECHTVNEIWKWAIPRWRPEKIPI